MAICNAVYIFVWVDPTENQHNRFSCEELKPKCHLLVTKMLKCSVIETSQCYLAETKNVLQYHLDGIAADVHPKQMS